MYAAKVLRTMGPHRSQFRSAACCSSRPELKGNTTSTRFWLIRRRSRLIVSRTYITTAHRSDDVTLTTGRVAAEHGRLRNCMHMIACNTCHDGLGDRPFEKVKVRTQQSVAQSLLRHRRTGSATRGRRQLFRCRKQRCNMSLDAAAPAHRAC